MIGDNHIHLEVVDSTNRYARDLVSSEPPHGSLITADSQSAGRGRLDRQWLAAPAQNILASIILYPQREAEDWGGLPMLAGLAVHNAVRRLSEIETHLKWPNDVLVESRKLSGVLVETGRFGALPWTVIGIGLNVNQVHYEGTYRLPPTSLALEAGRTFDTEEVLSTLCKELDMLYDVWNTQGNAPILEEWRKATKMLGKIVFVEENGTRVLRRAIDIQEDCSLLVELPDGKRNQVYAGDVSLQKESDS